MLDYLCPKLSFLTTAFNSLFGEKNLRETLERKRSEVAKEKENEVYNVALKELKGELKIEENVLDKLTVDYFS